jgi:SagB-type dehydrogenase family enzyme
VSEYVWNSLREPAAEETRTWELYHENSKISRFDTPISNAFVTKRMQEISESLDYEAYPVVRLPMPKVPAAMSVQEAILSRRTARELRARPMSFDAVATLLSLAYGITNRDTLYIRPFRAAPSGGALYPLDLFIYTIHVNELEPGLYHYNPTRHELRLVREGDLSRMISDALLQPSTPHEASLIVFLAGFFERSTFKYGERGYRFVLLEAGHVAQNINLVAVALGLGCRNIGGFFDRQMDDLLQLDGCNQSTLYLIAIGEMLNDGTKGVPGTE